MKATMATTGGKLLACLAGAALFTTGASAQQIFWTNHGGFGDAAVNQGSIWAMEVGGTASSLITGLNRPLGLAVTSDSIYFAEDGTPGNASRIARYDRSSGVITTLFDGFNNAQGLVLNDGTLRWTTFFDGLMSGAVAGGAHTAHGNAAGSPNLTGIDYHSGTNTVYYGQPNGDRGLYSWNGTDHTLVANGMVTNDWSFNDLVIDEIGGWLYYTDVDQNTIWRSGLDGSGAAALATDATAVHGLAMYGNDLYWVGRDHIGRVDPTALGGTSEILASGFSGTGFHIAVIPEPSTYALLFGLAMGAMVLVRRRLRK